MSPKLHSTETAPSGVREDTILCWLENETIKILQDDNLGDLKRLFRFRLYQDDSLPRFRLRDRPGDTLDTLLILLRSEAGNQEPLSDLDIDQKIQGILGLLPQRPPPPNLVLEWTPQDALYKMDTEGVAAEIDRASYLQFRQVPFESWVRYALGYPKAPVEKFLDQHHILCDQLSCFLLDNPEASEKFSQVEEVNYIPPHGTILLANRWQKLQNRSPFAHWVVVNSLRQLPHGSTLSSSSCAKFLVDPLREFFANENRELSEILKRLALLSVRFQQSYMHEEEIRWDRFQTNTMFFELLCSKSAQDIAYSTTTVDTNALGRLRPQDVIGISNYIRRLDTRWRKLCLEVELVVAEGALGNTVVDLALVSDPAVVMELN
ncbi:MAG: hypothetical protein M1840_002659 [Geoglossum simile]|nr:MAG: hypothetical protein M1840_002659 [Geoglossum simile]